MSPTSSHAQPEGGSSASALRADAGQSAAALASRASGAPKRPAPTAAAKPSSKKPRTSSTARRSVADPSRSLAPDGSHIRPYKVLNSSGGELLCICVHWIPDRRKDAKIMDTVWTKVLPGMLRIKRFAGVIVGDADQDGNPNNSFDGGPYYRLYFNSNGNDRPELEWQVQQVINRFDAFAEDLMVFIPKNQIY